MIAATLIQATYSGSFLESYIHEHPSLIAAGLQMVKRCEFLLDLSFSAQTDRSGDAADGLNGNSTLVNTKTTRTEVCIFL